MKTAEEIREEILCLKDDLTALKEKLKAARLEEKLAEYRHLEGKFIKAVAGNSTYLHKVKSISKKPRALSKDFVEYNVDSVKITLYDHSVHVGSYKNVTYSHYIGDNKRYTWSSEETTEEEYEAARSKVIGILARTNGTLFTYAKK